MEPHDRLKHVRIARGDTLAAVAQQSGVAERMLRAIEDGRFDDLPRGIYARAAIRSYALALGLDAGDVLAACEPLLPSIDDPIGAMCRLRGVRQSAPREHAAETTAIADVSRPDWRRPAAVALDALLLGAILMVVVGSAAVIARAPVAALGGSAAAFAFMGVLLGASYFLWLGGMSGATAGERWIGLRSHAESLQSLNLHAVAIRAWCCATDDLRFLRELGLWIGRNTTNGNSALGSADGSENPHPAVARS